MEQIKFVDLQKQWEPLIPKIMKEIEETVKKGEFVSGSKTLELEMALSYYTECSGCLTCNSGTSALQMILMGLGIGPGDEVILPRNTFIATYFAVQHVGATAVLVSTDQFYTIDPYEVKRAITPKTKAIIAVHLYGQQADMKALRKIGADYDLYLIEDAAQALGSMDIEGYGVGECSTAAALSFYPSKNLGTWGEGGAVITEDKSLFYKMKNIRDQGQCEKHDHTHLGHNFRMSNLLAIPLLHGLRELDEWNNKRIQVAAWYREELDKASIGKGAPSVRSEAGKEARHIYHLYEFNLTKLKWDLEMVNLEVVPTGTHYPKQIQEQVIFEKRKSTSQFRPSLKEYMCNKGCAIKDKLISLPMHPFVTKEQVKYVVYKLKESIDLQLKHL